MQACAYRLFFGVLSFLLLFPACSGGGSDTGTSSHGGASGGAPGSGGASGGAPGSGGVIGGAPGSGGASDGGGGIDGRRTNDGGGGTDGRPANDGGGAADGRRTNDGGGGTDGGRTNDGGGGTDGRPTNDGGGGADGRRTNDGGRTTDAGNLLDASGPSYCAPCLDEAEATVLACPAQRPATQDDLGAICRQFLGASREVIVKLGGCAVPVTLPGCDATSPDPTVDVLSVDLIPPHGVDCQYSRATGALVGQTMSNDSPHYCGNQAYVATTSGVTNPWCTAGGSSLVSVTCSASDGGVIDAPPDAPVSSACSACGADELCVGFYDGTCTPMSSRCVKVSATTRESILVKHESCFGKAIGNEICGNADGGIFWGCGDPACPNEPLVSDINCYGP